MHRLPTSRLASTVAVAAIALIVGFALGRGWSPVATTTAGSQATPEAECLPTAVASPVALASPVAAGQSLAYDDGWTVTVSGATKLTRIGAQVPEGVFIAVALTITNDTPAGRFFPFEQLSLLDDKARPFVVDAFSTNLYPNSRGIHATFNPSLPTDTAVIFDVRDDAGDTFVLQSASDPSFRVELDLAQRGQTGSQPSS